MPVRRHSEVHRTGRIGWLRAAVLGANDGIVSTASLIVGVASAGTSVDNVLIAGIAALVAGAMSMAAGEYVSVSSQADIERADLDIERRELATDPAYETDELTMIYVRRGLDRKLARHVAEKLMSVDALDAHARDELGISSARKARPVQAAFASMLSFAVGAALPLAATALAPEGLLRPVVAIASLCFLAVLGAIAAQAGGASKLRGALRVTFWGTLAMVLTALIGTLAGTVV